MHDRYTKADIDAQTAAEAVTINGSIKQIRRYLDRPFGSVRWNADSPDHKQEPTIHIGP
jgi:hypothetical protein